MSLNSDKAVSGDYDRVKEMHCAPPGASSKSDVRFCTDDSLDSGIAGLKEAIRKCDKNYICRPNVETESPEAYYIVDPTTTTTYLKGKFLGKGGFASVHEMIDLNTNRIYAGKIIPKIRITKRHHLQKIAREILIHRDLIHTNVVRMHHFFEDSVNAYIILENCSRKSLVHVLKHRSVVTEPEVRYYLRQLISGVSYIHSKQVIHRDLKPGNMFLGEDMVVKVGDFGLATQVDGDKRVTICGTPNYIAPEVLNKLSYSFEADVWAIGCIMYAMLVGQPPFETATLKETYARIVGNQYTLPTLASEAARSLISELLQPVPDDRPKLEDILKHEFFTSGYTPDTLSPTCCYTVPKFAIGSPASRSPQAHTQPQIIYQTSAVSQKGPASVAKKMKKLICDVNGLRLQPGNLTTLPASVNLSSKDKAAGNNAGVVNGAASQKEKELNFRHSSLKQKISSVLCPDRMTLCRKRANDAAALYRYLSDCIRKMPLGCDANPPLSADITPLFVSKWIDYSNKYGFGFQLSDKSVGVLFNDSTRISVTGDFSRVEFHDAQGRITAYQGESVPDELNDRLTLLRSFSAYMDEHLTEGGDIKEKVPLAAASRNKSLIPHMRRWVRTNTAIIMELVNGTLQINFFKDHTKVIITLEKDGYMLTYINSDRVSVSYWLAHVAQYGCEANIYDRLRFAAAVLKEFVELDGEEV